MGSDEHSRNEKDFDAFAVEAEKRRALGTHEVGEPMTDEDVDALAFAQARVLTGHLRTERKESMVSLVLCALGYVDAQGEFQEPDEAFCATVYAAVEGDQDALTEIADIGRAQRAAESELSGAVSSNLHRLKKLADAKGLALSVWHELDQAHRDYQEAKRGG